MTMVRRTAALLALAGVAACRPAAHTVVVYSNLSPELLSFAEGAFEDAHPDVDMRTVPMSASQALTRLKSERARPRADIWWGAPSWVLDEAAADSLLEPAHPSWLGAVPADRRDPRERWIGSFDDPLVFVVNTDSLPLALAPRDWIDLLHPRLMGSLLLPAPGSSEAGDLLLAGRLTGQGGEEGDTAEAWDGLRRLAAAAGGFATDDGALVSGVASGRAWAGVARLSEAQAALAGAGGGKPPITLRVPESGTPVLVQGIAVVAGAADPQAAADFVEWTGDAGVVKGMQERFYRMPARADMEVAPPAWLADILPRYRPEVPPADVVAAHLKGWLAKWAVLLAGT